MLMMIYDDDDYLNFLNAQKTQSKKLKK